MKLNETPKLIDRKYIWFVLGLFCVGFLGYHLTRLAMPGGDGKGTQDPNGTTVVSTFPQNTAGRSLSAGEREARVRLDEEAIDVGAIAGQRGIIFKDRESMERFLSRLGDGVSVLSRIDQLNALVVRFLNEDDLLTLLDGSEETSLIFPVNVPSFEGVGAQAGAVPIGNRMLKWLGIDVDNSAWGKGVKIAILDTGVSAHPAFSSLISHLNLVPWPENIADLNPHGTAVASVIIGNDPLTPGIAPGAEILSVRIADDNGRSNSSLIAQGILAAVDGGAQIINISLGGFGNSSLVDAAVAYAQQRGVIIVASSGNSGQQGVMQPAANPNVIAVGAVDANNQHLAFSTYGPELAISAPGFGVNVAYSGESSARVNGTSFSAPAIAGTIAGVMSNGIAPAQSSTQAVDTVFKYSNDIGTAGPDPTTGAGVPDFWRILNGNQRGIHDAAITSLTTSQSDRGTQVNVLVQNQGTETLINAGVEINLNGQLIHANIPTLTSGDSRVISVPINQAETLQISSTIRLTGGQTDQRPTNDNLSITITPSP